MCGSKLLEGSRDILRRAQAAQRWSSCEDQALAHRLFYPNSSSGGPWHSRELLVDTWTPPTAWRLGGLFYPKRQHMCVSQVPQGHLLHSKRGDVSLTSSGFLLQELFLSVILQMREDMGM